MPAHPFTKAFETWQEEYDGFMQVHMPVEEAKEYAQPPFGELISRLNLYGRLFRFYNTNNQSKYPIMVGRIDEGVLVFRVKELNGGLVHQKIGVYKNWSAGFNTAMTLLFDSENR